MANSIEYIYEVIDRFSGPLRKFERATEKAESALNRGRAAMARYAEKAAAMGRTLRNVGAGMTAAVTVPIGALALSAIKAASSVETMTVAFESMLGSAEKADAMVNQLLGFAAKTPFQIEGIGAATKQLLAIGVAQEDVISKLQFLGDIAAGANVPLRDMASIFAKSKAKGKAMTEELLQLSDRGIPIINVLSERLNVSKDSIFEMASQGKISFDILEGALKSMAEEGGIFYKQMIKQSKTLSGLWSTFKDALFIGSAGLGKTIVKMFDLKNIAVKVIDAVEKLSAGFMRFVEANPGLAKFAAAIIGLLFVMGPVIAAIGFMVIGISAISAPVIAAVAAFAAISGAFVHFYASGHPVIDLLKSMWADFKVLGQPVADFIEYLGLGSSASISLGDAMKVLGNAIYIAITPLKIFLQMLATAVKTTQALINGDFSAAGSALARGFREMGRSVHDAFNVGASTFEMGTPDTYSVPETTAGLAESLATFRAQQSKVDVSGSIGVRGENGATVTESNINLNGGSNVATAY